MINATLYFMDGGLVGYELAICTPFTVGKIDGPALTTNSSSIGALGWKLVITKQQSINIVTPKPGGGAPLQTEFFNSGYIYVNNINTDTYFQVRFVKNGVVKSVMVASR